ncbi:hypothetical protein B488_12140 [Liberibacter crescens BT-1]|uniref:Uncharacterized protein n=1 Tax=Liberibacter crescens (strain BT-1) TaxID=1215343 RepID=L0EXV3_LIBCB|nr:hypothetical protein B488_12140 [Liberibacter crescens BT-1]
MSILREIEGILEFFLKRLMELLSWSYFKTVFMQVERFSPCSSMK